MNCGSNQRGFSTIGVAVAVGLASLGVGVAIQQLSKNSVKTYGANVLKDRFEAVNVSAASIVSSIAAGKILVDSGAGQIKEVRDPAAIVNNGSCGANTRPVIATRVIQNPPFPSPSVLPTTSGNLQSSIASSKLKTEWEFQSTGLNGKPMILIKQCPLDKIDGTGNCPVAVKISTKVLFDGIDSASSSPTYTRYNVTMLTEFPGVPPSSKRGFVELAKVVLPSANFGDYSCIINITRRGNSGNPYDRLQNHPRQYNDYEIFLIDRGEKSVAFADRWQYRSGRGSTQIDLQPGSPPPAPGATYIGLVRRGVYTPAALVIDGRNYWSMEPCNRFRYPGSVGCQYNYKEVPYEVRVEQCINGVKMVRDFRITTGDTYAGGVCGSPAVAGFEGCTCHATNIISPLVIDFVGKGINFTGKDALVSFNFNQGPTASTWLANPADVGFVALDRDENGTIDSIDELFGDMTLGPDSQHATDGYHAISKYDVNDDKLIDTNDEVYSRLLVWRDKNGNAKSDPGELKLLSEDGIESLSLKSTAAPNQRREDGNRISSSSSAMTFDKRSLNMHDIWFDVP